MDVHAFNASRIILPIRYINISVPSSDVPNRPEEVVVQDLENISIADKNMFLYCKKNSCILSQIRHFGAHTRTSDRHSILFIYTNLGQ